MVKIHKLASLLLGVLFLAAGLCGGAGASGVTVEKVQFKNNDITLVGNLYRPADFDKSKKYPAISVAHPWGGVKEQTAGIYAERLAEKGFITLAYDASHYGESGGEPRYYENPSERVEDIRCAIDYLSNRPDVAADHIGALGICAGGGYTIAAASTDARIKAAAGVSTYDIGDAARAGLKDVWPTTPDGIRATLQDIGKQRTKEARGEEPRITKLLPTERPGAGAPQFLQDAYEYYNTKRGGHKNAAGNFRYVSTLRQLEFYPFGMIEFMSPRPLLLIAGSKAQTLYFSERAYELAKDPKELYIIDGAKHFDLYDKEPYVTEAVDKLAGFFHTYLT